MEVKSWITSLGLGMVAGAAAILMAPKQSPLYRKADRAAQAIKQEAMDVLDDLRQTQ